MEVGMARFGGLARFMPFRPPARGRMKVRTVQHDTVAPPASADNPDEASFRALHAEREELERSLALAQARQRFIHDAAEVEKARDAEVALLRDLDRVLTQIRAAEYKRRPGARRW
ncbi:hypothetical protein [Methylobacterium sp. A54F]